MTCIASVKWRRIDLPGTDECRLLEEEKGWLLAGLAEYVEKGKAYRFEYRVECDPSWKTRSGHIQGWIERREIQWDYHRASNGLWNLNGAEASGLEAGLDIDLGFSPATNLAQIRRLDLKAGESADLPVAWLDPETGSLSYLLQSYRRLSTSTYAYESPGVGYAETLEVDPVTGFALRYPDLWVAVDLHAS